MVVSDGVDAEDVVTEELWTDGLLVISVRCRTVGLDWTDCRTVEEIIGSADGVRKMKEDAGVARTAADAGDTFVAESAVSATAAEVDAELRSPEMIRVVSRPVTSAVDRSIVVAVGVLAAAETSLRVDARSLASGR